METVRVAIEVDEAWPDYSVKVVRPSRYQIFGNDHAVVDIPQDVYGRFVCADMEYRAALDALLDAAGWRYEKGEDD